MACVCCFFDNENQKRIKDSCKTNTSFFNRLCEYKKKYLSELQSLVPVCNCNCFYSVKFKNDNQYETFCNDFLIDLKDKTEYIKLFFNDVIEIFKVSKKDKKTAIIKLNLLLENKCTSYNYANSLETCSLLFRGRKKENYDICDIHEYFHIPFNKYNLIEGQRFSRKHEPMFYLSKSMLTASEELEIGSDDLNFAVFCPKYSNFFQSKMYSLTNSIDITLNEILFALTSYGSKIDYDNNVFTFRKSNTNKFLGDSILFQILMFPTTGNSSSREEYYLPQLCAEIFKKKGCIGFIYQSSKTTKINDMEFRHSHFDYNYCFFVQKPLTGNYNDVLLNSFHHSCVGKCKNKISMNEIERSIEQYGNTLKLYSNIFNMNDYILFISNITLHFNTMKKITVENTGYYDSDIGKIELQLLYDIINHVFDIIKEPQKNGICKLQ